MNRTYRFMLCGLLGLCLYGGPALHTAVAATAPAVAVAAGSAVASPANSAALPASVRTAPLTKSAAALSSNQLSAPAAPAQPAANQELQRTMWQALRDRLQADGLNGADLDAAFSSLPLPSQDPMGRKIRELYRSAFMAPPPPPPNYIAPPPPRLYPHVATEANARTCRDFLAQHAELFARAERQYSVPRQVAVALLFVETRLGENLGSSDAFYTLASMASSRAPTQISMWLSQLPDAETRLDWIEQRMRQRSDWAYKEFTALIQHLRDNGLNPLGMPGSVYGAMGICQFMPSNLLPYGADGDNNGVVDLFTLADAVASLSNYLVKNGWKPAMTRAQQHKVLKRYNRLDIYANTILTLADLVVSPLPAAKTPSTVTKKTATSAARQTGSNKTGSGKELKTSPARKKAPPTQAPASRPVPKPVQPSGAGAR